MIDQWVRCKTSDSDSDSDSTWKNLCHEHWIFMKKENPKLEFLHFRINTYIIRLSLPYVPSWHQEITVAFDLSVKMLKSFSTNDVGWGEGDSGGKQIRLGDVEFFFSFSFQISFQIFIPGFLSFSRFFFPFPFSPIFFNPHLTRLIPLLLWKTGTIFGIFRCLYCLVLREAYETWIWI